MKGSVTWVCGELLCESLETSQLLFCLFVLLHCNIQKICFQTSIKTCRLLLYLIAKPLLCNIYTYRVSAKRMLLSCRLSYRCTTWVTVHTHTHTHKHSIDPVTFVLLLLDEPVTHSRATKEERAGVVGPHAWDTLTHTYTHTHAHTHTHRAAWRSCSLLSEAAEADGCLSVLLMRPSGPLERERWNIRRTGWRKRQYSCKPFPPGGNLSFSSLGDL